MLSSNSKRNILRIIPFGLIWLTFSIVYSFLERGLLGDLHHYPSTGNPYDFTTSLFTTAITATALGLLIGSIEIFYLNILFRKTSFLKKIFYKSVIYLFLIILILWVLTLISNAVVLQADVFSKTVWQNVLKFFLNFSFWSVEVYIAAVICVSLFYTEVSENLGRGVLINFLTGKYHKPVEEERVFMFVDMKSSTTIAEQIGHVRYFQMLSEYFSDLSESIYKHSGEIYQYVGDEVVVSWTFESGIRDNNCIRCFFAMKAALKKQAGKYNKVFGLVPEFKAGLHIGKVTTGEIGIIKKEIIFTGDVLNTTARVQGLCNMYKVDILISEHLIIKLQPDSRFRLLSLGESELRGRDEKVGLFTILPAQITS